MDKTQLEERIEAFCRACPGNTVQIEGEAQPLTLFEPPIFGYADAHDPMFEQLQQPEVVGPHHLLPADWVEDAATVVSFFLPFSQQVRQSNRTKQPLPSVEWLYGRVEGQQYVAQVCRELQRLLEEAGERAVIPALSERFWTVSEPDAPQGPRFTSNWSERHVAHVCGLGTFGLSKGLITRKGMAGRFGSLVTSWRTEPTPRVYEGPYDWCTRCGACIARCPADAIDLEHGKDHVICYRFQEKILPQLLPRFGCGKCQVGVPCERMIPTARG